MVIEQKILLLAVNVKKELVCRTSANDVAAIVISASYREMFNIFGRFLVPQKVLQETVAMIACF